MGDRDRRLEDWSVVQMVCRPNVCRWLGAFLTNGKQHLSQSFICPHGGQSTSTY